MKIPSRSKNKLHRVAHDMTTDWERIPPAQRNDWQKIANRTNGIMTPGNAMTLTGSVLVIFGLTAYTHGYAAVGIVAFGAGRLADILDGNISEYTKTKSVLGASIDAGADWLQLVITLSVLAVHGSLPLLAILIIGIPKTIDSASTIAAKIRKVRINVTGESKLGAAVIWMSIGLFMIHDSVNSGDTNLLLVLLLILAWSSSVIGTLLRISSVMYYARIGFGREHKKQL